MSKREAASSHQVPSTAATRTARLTMLQYAAARAPLCRQRSAAALRPRAAAREATPARRRDAYMIKDGGIGDFGQTQERHRSLCSTFKRRGLSPEAQRAGPSKPVALWSGGGILTVLVTCSACKPSSPACTVATSALSALSASFSSTKPEPTSSARTPLVASIACRCAAVRGQCGFSAGALWWAAERMVRRGAHGWCGGWCGGGGVGGMQ